MGLNIINYVQNKSVHINDTFRMYIVFNKQDIDGNNNEVFSIAGFTPPKMAYKEEVLKFGNNSKIFQIPDYESVEPLHIELLENETKDTAHLISKLLSLNFNFNPDVWAYTGDYLYEIRIEILNNTFDKVLCTYTYRYCKLTNYEVYTLDTQSDDVAKYSLDFSYMYSSEVFSGEENALKSELEGMLKQYSKNSFEVGQHKEETEARLDKNSDVYKSLQENIEEEQKKLNERPKENGQAATPADGISPPASSATRHRMTDEEFAKWNKEFAKGNKAGALQMTTEQYLDYKYTAEQKVKEEIEKRIASGDTNFTKHVGVNGAVFYTMKKTSAGKNVNRVDDNGKKAEDDVMMHTVGSIMSNLDSITKQMGKGGESMVLFSDFALVKEEAFSNGRVYSAAAGSDRVGSGVNSSMFGIERNTGSGIFDNKDKSGVIHQTDRNVQLIGDWKSDAAKEGLSLTKTAKGSDKQISMGYLESEMDVMAAVFSEMNANGTGNYNFDDAKVYGYGSVKENKKHTLTKDVLKGGTTIAAHDSVSNKGKNGEAGVDTLKELQAGLAARMNGGKIDKSYYDAKDAAAKPAPAASTEELLKDEKPAPAEAAAPAAPDNIPAKSSQEPAVAPSFGANTSTEEPKSMSEKDKRKAKVKEDVEKKRQEEAKKLELAAAEEKKKKAEEEKKLAEQKKAAEAAKQKKKKAEEAKKKKAEEEQKKKKAAEEQKKKAEEENKKKSSPVTQPKSLDDEMTNAKINKDFTSFVAADAAKKDIELGTYKGEKGTTWGVNYNIIMNAGQSLLGSQKQSEALGSYTAAYDNYMSKYAPEKPKDKK